MRKFRKIIIVGLVFIFNVFVFMVFATGTSINQGGISQSNSENLGIECSAEDLEYGLCKVSVYKMLNIRKKDNQNTDIGIFTQDLVLAATSAVGTIFVILLIVNGLKLIFAAGDSGKAGDAKKGIVNGIIGLILVMSSYVIIRLIQFLAKGGE